MELKEVTVPTKPEHIMDTQWGRITYREWCEKEKARREGKGYTVEIRESKTKRGVTVLSLWVLTEKEGL